MAIPTATDLVLRTTSEGTEARFTKLCAILGDGIIGSVWMYASQDLDAIEASIDALPTVLKALDVGSARYLKVTVAAHKDQCSWLTDFVTKAIIPQLTYPLQPTNPWKVSPPSLQIASLQALVELIRVCAPRIHKWKGVIIEAVVKCWVTIVDSGKADDGMSCSDSLTSG